MYWNAKFIAVIITEIYFKKTNSFCLLLIYIVTVEDESDPLSHQNRPPTDHLSEPVISAEDTGSGSSASLMTQDTDTDTTDIMTQDTPSLKSKDQTMVPMETAEQPVKGKQTDRKPYLKFILCHVWLNRNQKELVFIVC